MTVALRSGFDPATALERAAIALADTDDGRFATALVVVLDPVASTLTWANAGHPAGWLLPGGGTTERVRLRPTGPLLSSFGGHWVTGRSSLLVGDVVLAWSDGLVETRAADQELSDDALAAIVAELGTGEPSELVAALLARLRDGAREWRRDDITLVAVRRTS
jgi:serine phosphatase RsbU (regulator of sigma subunit)